MKARLQSALLALGCAVMVPLLAQPVAAQADGAAQAIEIETIFDPPLDTLLRFRISVTKRGTHASWVEQLRLVRAGEEFVGHWRIEPGSIRANSGEPPDVALLQPLTSETIAFDLDSEGSIVRVRDWELVQERLLRLLPEVRPLLLANDKTNAADVDKVLSILTRMYQGMTAESATDTIAAYLGAALGWGGIPLVVGETYEDDVEVPVSLLGTSLTQRIQMTATAAEPGKSMSVTVRTEADPESFDAIVRAALDRFGLKDDPATIARIKRELRQSEGLAMVESAVFVVDLPTGLPLSYEGRRDLVASDQEVGIVYRVEWLR